jgi:hypothetical protein
MLFPESWFTAGVITAESAQYFTALAERSPERPARYWRWAAFRDWSEEREELTAEQCRAVFALGEADPDTNLGTALMCHALLRRLCPPDLRARAQNSTRSAVSRTAGRR